MKRGVGREMIYPIKTLNQLPQLLKSFRKEKGLTQADMGEKLGITQQSYAYFEANPASATLERLFMALRLLDVEISLVPLENKNINKRLMDPRHTEKFANAAENWKKLYKGLMDPRYTEEFTKAADNWKKLNKGLVDPRYTEEFTKAADNWKKLNKGLMDPRYTEEFAKAADNWKKLNKGLVDPRHTKEHEKTVETLQNLEQRQTATFLENQHHTTPTKKKEK